jgi:AraC-like DNA-binding protein
MNVDARDAHVAKQPDRRASQSRLDLVQRAEMLALADLDKTLHVAALSRTLTVSERTLRKAFKNTYGLPPCRHLRMLRLSRVRRALLSAHDRVLTVTEIATDFGFAELGRFSVEYRKVFGESPSVTLRRASRSHYKSEQQINGFPRRNRGDDRRR